MAKKTLARSILSFLALGLVVGLGSIYYPFDKRASSLLPVAEEQKEGQNNSLVKLSQASSAEWGITLETAKPGSLHMILTTRGKIVLHPDRVAHILPKVSGIAKEALKNIGDSVRAGELLATFVSQEMAEIGSTYLAAYEKHKLARQLFEREAKLHEKQISAEQDYLNAEYSVEESAIQLQQAKQKLLAFGLTEEEIAALHTSPHLNSISIRSPMDGTILNRQITQGEFIDSNATIYTVADLSLTWVEFSLSPKDLSKVKKGQLIDLHLPQEEPSAQAKIIYISPIIEEDSIRANGVAELKNPKGLLRPGTFVTIDIITETIKAPLLILSEAVQTIDGEECLFVKTDEGFEKRAVQLGRRGSKQSEVLAGIHEGEQYAATQTFLLKAELAFSLGSSEND